MTVEGEGPLSVLTDTEGWTTFAPLLLSENIRAAGMFI
ncbi:hypothetical protein GGE09_000543 [Roseobacter sp. N2S]|nr:hypothetical protein [Roseobacter sp. N2S]